MSFARCLWLVIVSSVLSAGALLAAQKMTPPEERPGFYRVRDVGKIPWSSEVSMNGAGQVVSTDDSERAFVWTDGTKEMLPGLPGGGNSTALDINDAGEIVGACIVGADSVPVLWRNRIPIDLRPGWCAGGGATAINEESQIVGWADMAPHYDRRQGFFLDMGVIPPRGGTVGTFGGDRSTINDIASGQRAVGHSDTGWDDHAFLYRPSHGLLDLGTLHGGDSRATAINDDGVVVGISEAQSWSDGWRPFLWEDGEMIRLPLLPDPFGEETVPQDINLHRDVVGWAEDDIGNRVAIIIRGFTSYDLNGRVPQLGDWELTEAFAINDAGQIAGRGLRNGELRAFLLDPLPHVRVYGSGYNPPGSLVVEGHPIPGLAMRLGVDNPLGTQNPGAIPFLHFSLAPDPSFPIGSLFPGWGMNGLGELLIGIHPLDLIMPGLVGPPWTGAGIPVMFDIAIPEDEAVFGMTIYAQGVLFDALGAPGSRCGLTEAVQLGIGQ